VGLERKLKAAKAFYGVLAVATLIGLLINFTKLDPINGVTAVPVMCFLMLMASNPQVIGKLHLPLYLRAVGWAAAGIMALAAIGMFLTSG
jgi:Mn2+/Fe2+ NRAMP family transporter